MRKNALFLIAHSFLWSAFLPRGILMVDYNVKRRYEKKCSVLGGCEGYRFMEEAPWCKTAGLG
jgi:hypothetical protein